MVSLPAPFSDIPRVELLFPRPSDIERLSRLTNKLNCGATIWIKREDCNSGLAFGGNKVRKLEYVVADALARGADTLVTTGGIQSNHMRQTAAAAARLGLKAALYPRAAVAGTEAEYDYAGNVQLNEILGAETFPVGTSEDDVLATLKHRGQKPYPIPSGASLHPLGGLGYARWAFEVLEQEEQLGVVFDTVVVATGSGSTIGGMIAGFGLAEKMGRLRSRKRVVGINILGREGVEELVLSIARNAGDKIGVDPGMITAEHFELEHSFLGEAYGKLDERTADAVKELARTEGILTDPVYTGKAFAGLLHVAKERGFGQGSNVLFCHTGGQSALSAYPTLK
ncbi:1-aminocyclopropane-1-carboxylate deaminase-like protein [Hapsidospora chrysogenum ATCC 11550]|uniref:1-aminocyclopropane-1-carboxylate deaminase-like protein n=1 Tax=Hapsidospora chrysogenum (strain ATCC 11550 / CBS 779.69 / DSM 880 / IAM 14645 / JCM 23072 / IMI 49137) TaxID=857340 RepID=A0A086T8I5_HAPC1|nr:1-aminocyclopropane-1-carboxylate deaminase-like protein [Hapsidospora chrysogenum ATCC 11550]